MLVSYIQDGMDNFSYDRRGKYIMAVTQFLSDAPSIGRRGYRAYCKENASYLVDKQWAHEAICDFLGFFGMGYKKKEDTRRSKAMTVTEQKHEIMQQETVNNFLVWLQNEKDYSSNTLQSYKYTVTDFYSYFDTFSSDTARRYVLLLEQQGRAPQTIALRISALEKLAEYLNKPIKVKRPKMQRTLNTENIPTESEYIKLCNYTRDKYPMYYILIRIMATTGCRVSELRLFTYEMLQEGTCMLQGKGRKYRQFFFVKELRELAKGKSGIIMLNRYGKPMSDRGLSSMLYIFCEECGIDKSKGHPHAFRHFFAKMYLKKTKDVIQLAELLGHQNIDTTRIYLQKSQQEQRRDVNRVVSW